MKATGNAVRLRTAMKEIFFVLITIFGVVGAGYFLLVLVYLIPASRISDNVADSAYILMTQGTYPSGYLDGWFLDNFTDADCISVTYNASTKNPFYSALDAYQLGGENDSHAASIEGLWSTVQGDTAKKGDHTYLWHGYRIWLRPLLMKYNITNIRFFCYGILIFLVTVLCVMLAYRLNNVLAFVPFLATFTFFNFQMEALSLLFFNDLAVALVGCMFIACTVGQERWEKYYNRIFAGIGALLAFTSMLILPILTIGFPIIFWLIFDRRCLAWKEKVLGVIRYSICWLFGYAITMFAKIGISAAVFQSNKGIQNVSLYTGNSTKYTVAERFQCTINVFLKVLQRSEIQRDLLIAAVFLSMIYITLRCRKNLRRISDYIPYFIVALYPCVWCFLCCRHAGHGWTYFNYSISMFALLSVLMSLAERGKEGRKGGVRGID